MSWIKTSDKLPKPTERAIGYDNLYGRIGEVMIAPWNSERLIFVDSDDDDCSIVLWTPMPQIPKKLIEEIEEENSHVSVE